MAGVAKIYGNPNFRPKTLKKFLRKAQDAYLEFVIVDPDKEELTWVVQVQGELAEKWSYLQENDLISVGPGELKNVVKVSVRVSHLLILVKARKVELSSLLLHKPAVETEAEVESTLR